MVGRGSVVREVVGGWVLVDGEGVIFVGRGFVVGRVNGSCIVKDVIIKYRSDLRGVTGGSSGGGIEVDETDVGGDAWDDDEMGGGVDVCVDGVLDGDAGEYEAVCDGLDFSILSSNFSNNL